MPRSLYRNDPDQTDEPDDDPARAPLVPLALMALIFVLSAQSDLDSGLGMVDLIGRKLVHVASTWC